MKKLLSLLLIGGISLTSNAQDKKFQIGLVTGGVVTWVKTQTSEIERNGIGGGFTVGLGGNYLFNKNVGLASGVQFDIENFKINYGDAVTGTTPSGNVFYGFDDTDIKKYDKNSNMIEDLTDTSNVLELMTRKFRAKYVTVPIFLKFQTDKIGQFIYYGKFGLRSSFLAGVRMDDEGYAAAYDPGTDQFVRTSASTNTLNTNMKPVTVLKGLTPVRLGIGIYGGAEWNFTGSTYLYFEAGFNYGVTPSMQIESSHLVNQVDDGAGTVTREALDIQNNPQHLLEFNVGILF
ncbi:outer membrane beta-barrel protein [Paracrocinitomix mangrovi]|uniref:outer membrane beta-barrel protein n=1 Tax=Paracrocinitomix mangrovi TaxID=2862509 RepID=UPI001C8EBFEE|nr:outer membrane beta-barrel protein [Paracrocinitomix mangrovi]UKN03503.1 outer membrane beta-barrel protein [Paracrocinitomix mangrovi]